MQNEGDARLIESQDNLEECGLRWHEKSNE